MGVTKCMGFVATEAYFTVHISRYFILLTLICKIEMIMIELNATLDPVSSF